MRRAFFLSRRVLSFFTIVVEKILPTLTEDPPIFLEQRYLKTINRRIDESGTFAREKGRTAVKSIGDLNVQSIDYARG